MKETWRWFGPEDPVSLECAKQAGASGIVTALHHRYRGEPWSLNDVLERKADIERRGLEWSVVESIPVHNSIKLRSGEYRKFISAWKDSLVAVAKAGVKVICYNFMPVVDWVRTDLKWKLPSTGYTLRFDIIDFAAYDLFLLRRKAAEVDYPPATVSAAKKRFEDMPAARQKTLEHTIIAGLPGNEGSHDREGIRRLIGEYEGMTASYLHDSLAEFLWQIVPVAEELGVRLAIHPDDPPFSLFGMPRVVSTEEDAARILLSCDTPANGLTFCVGSYGARPDNNLEAMFKRFADRVHFVHLRQVLREQDGSFFEAEHLNGSSDIVGVIRALLSEERRRRLEGRADADVPIRPDHGHLLADDISKEVNPGYSFIGRMKGLAEVRGVARGLQSAFPELAG